VTPTELVHRTTANRPRLFGSLLGGVVLYALLPAALSVPVRFVLAWNSALVVFLVLTLVMFARATPQKLRYRAQREDPSQVVILMLMIAAALASFVAIGFVLHDAKEQPGLLAIAHVILAGLTILISWAFAHTMFALHYAHGFYGDPRRPAGTGPAEQKKVAGGLAFPGEEKPDYWDFLYFSFVIGMTSQVSDVQVTGRAMRRLTLGHGVVSFLFNTVILALTINLLAGLL